MWRVTRTAHHTCTCEYVTCDRTGAPDFYLWLRDVLQERCARLVPVITWRVTGKVRQTCTCDYATCYRKDAPDLYLWWRDVWQEWHTRFVPVIMWRVTGMTHQIFTCDYVTCDRNDAPDFGGRIFFSRVNFLCWLLFRYPFHPRVTAVARKRPRSLCQKRRWQVTAKHAYTLRMWLCMKWHGAWLYGVHRTCAEMAAVSCGNSHASAVSTPLRWIFKKRAIKSYSLM